MRGRLSEFLKSLASLFSTIHTNNAPAPINLMPAAEPVITPTKVSILTSKPRSPVLPPEDVAAYWKGGLDYVNFRSFSEKSNDAVAHKLVLSLLDVTQVASQIEEGQDAAVGEDVNVVLLLCQVSKRDRSLVNRHPLLAVPAVLIEQKFLAPRTSAAPVLNPAYLSPDQKADTFAIGDAHVGNERMFIALSQLSTDKSLQLDWVTWWSTALNVVRDLLKIDKDDSPLHKPNTSRAGSLSVGLFGRQNQAHGVNR